MRGGLCLGAIAIAIGSVCACSRESDGADRSQTSGAVAVYSTTGGSQTGGATVPVAIDAVPIDELALCDEAMRGAELGSSCPRRLPPRRDGKLCDSPCLVHNDLGTFVLMEALFDGGAGYEGMDGGRAGHFVMFARAAGPGPSAPCGSALDAGSGPTPGSEFWVCPPEVVSDGTVAEFHFGAVKANQGHVVLAVTRGGTYLELSLHGDTAANRQLLGAILESMP